MLKHLFPAGVEIVKFLLGLFFFLGERAALFVVCVGEGFGDLFVEVFDFGFQSFYFVGEVGFLFGELLSGVVGKGLVCAGGGLVLLLFGLLFFVLLVFFCFFLLAFFFVEPEFRVGAGVGVEFFVVDFDDSSGEFVKEVAVVGNDYKSAFVVAQGFFYGFAGLYVQVVSGLVEDQGVPCPKARCWGM